MAPEVYLSGKCCRNASMALIFPFNVIHGQQGSVAGTLSPQHCSCSGSLYLLMSKVSQLLRQTDSALSSLDTSESIKVNSFLIGHKFMDITDLRALINFHFRPLLQQRLGSHDSVFLRVSYQSSAINEVI